MGYSLQLLLDSKESLLNLDKTQKSSLNSSNLVPKNNVIELTPVYETVSNGCKAAKFYFNNNILKILPHGWDILRGLEKHEIYILDFSDADSEWEILKKNMVRGLRIAMERIRPGRSILVKNWNLLTRYSVGLLYLLTSIFQMVSRF